MPAKKPGYFLGSLKVSSIIFKCRSACCLSRKPLQHVSCLQSFPQTAAPVACRRSVISERRSALCSSMNS